MIKQLGLAAAVLAVNGGTMLPASADPRPAVSWSGDVDDTTIIYIHRGDVRTRTVFGKAAGNISAQVYGRLPEGPIRVFLEDRDGRGRVSVLQQPNPDNDFTAAVRIYDPQAGRSHYNFTLAWEPLPGRDGNDYGFRGRPHSYRITPERFGGY